MAREGDVSGRGWVGEVLGVARRSPSLVRVELGGAGLAGFASLGVPDEACVFEFPGPAAPAGLRPNPGRWYSLQEVAADRIAIGIVHHPGGLGSDWAERASVGDTLRITHHNSWFRRPAEARWQLLLGDITALPAIDRIITESAPELATRAIVEIPHPDDQMPWEHAADVRWVLNPALGSVGSRLGEIARELVLAEGPGYVYVAGEAAATRAVRRRLRHDLGLPNESFGAVGYWRRARGGLH